MELVNTFAADFILSPAGQVFGGRIDKSGMAVGIQAIDTLGHSFENTLITVGEFTVSQVHGFHHGEFRAMSISVLVPCALDEYAWHPQPQANRS